MRRWEIWFLQGIESCNLYNIFCLFAPQPDDLTGFSALIVSGGSRWLELRVHNGRTLLSALFRSRADFTLLWESPSWSTFRFWHRGAFWASRGMAADGAGVFFSWGVMALLLDLGIWLKSGFTYPHPSVCFNQFLHGLLCFRALSDVKRRD